MRYFDNTSPSPCRSERISWCRRHIRACAQEMALRRRFDLPGWLFPWPPVDDHEAEFRRHAAAIGQRLGLDSAEIEEAASLEWDRAQAAVMHMMTKIVMHGHSYGWRHAGKKARADDLCRAKRSWPAYLPRPSDGVIKAIVMAQVAIDNPQNWGL